MNPNLVGGKLSTASIPVIADVFRACRLESRRKHNTDRAEE